MSNEPLHVTLIEQVFIDYWCSVKAYSVILGGKTLQNIWILPIENDCVDRVFLLVFVCFLSRFMLYSTRTDEQLFLMTVQPYDFFVILFSNHKITSPIAQFYDANLGSPTCQCMRIACDYCGTPSLYIQCYRNGLVALILQLL